MRKYTFGALFVAFLFALAPCLLAGPFTHTMIIVPSIAPNYYMSPSWNLYSTAALTAIAAGSNTGGTPGTPGYYQAVTSGWVMPGDVVVSGFNSWRGLAPGAFAGEFGNRLHFGLQILGNGQTFRLSNLWFNMTSTPDNFFAYCGGPNGAAGGYSYSIPCPGVNDGPFTTFSPWRVGVDYGPDGVRGGGNDTIYTSGTATQLIHELIYVGVGNALDANLEPGATNQDKLNSGMNYLAGMGVDMRYCLYDDIGEEMVCSDSHIDIVPEPATGLLLLAGLGGLALVRRLRRR